MTKREMNEAMADRLEKFAVKTYERQMRNVDNDEDYKECCRLDLADTRKIAYYLRQNKLNEAYRVMFRLDTAARDNLPISVAGYITEEAD